MSISPPPQTQPGHISVRVWDIPTRLFHWLLAVLVGVSWYTGSKAGSLLEWHYRSGYAILVLLLFRVAWGFLGGWWARFASFVRGPSAAIHHIQDLFSPRDLKDVGHNPIGGWMVLAILLILLVQVGTGLFLNDSDMGLTGGPYADYVSGALRSTLASFHALNSKLILAVIALHVAAIVIYLIWKGENLIGAMITGRKHLDPELGSVAAKANATGSSLRAILLLGCAIAAVYALVKLA